MVIAVPVMRVVEMALHEVVHVISMWNPLVTAVWAVYMSWLMRSTIVVWRTAVRIVLADWYVVVIHMIAVYVMEMPIVKIIGVAIVLHSGMTAICAMLMGVAFVFGTSGHDALHLASSAGRFASSTVHGLIWNA
jgi:hypothetical protein